MAKIRTLEELRKAIRDMEHQHYINEQQMRRRVTKIADNLKPINVAKNLIGQVLGGPGIKINLFRMAAGIATSFVVKKFFKKGLSNA